MKTILSVIAAIVFVALFFVACFGLQFGGLKWHGFFAKESANIERQVFEQSNPYVRGKSDMLSKYYQEYIKADEANRQVMTNVIKAEFGDFDDSTITSPALRAFLHSVRGY